MSIKAKSPTVSTRGAIGGLRRLLVAAESDVSSSRRRAFILSTFCALMALLVGGVALATGAQPKVTIKPASGVQYATATAEGTVDPVDHGTEYRFQYVIAAKFGESGWAEAESVGTGSLPEGAGSTPVQAELTGLHPNATYHLRLLAENSEGEVVEAVAPTFTTKPVTSPTATIAPVTSVTATTARVAGHIDPNAPEGAPTSTAVEAGFLVHWRFVCTPECTDATGELEADDSSHEVSGEISGLSVQTHYEVRLVAENAGGAQTEVSAGPVGFTTPPVNIESVFASDVSSSSATLHAQLTPGSSGETKYRFEYGPTESYGDTVPIPESEAVLPQATGDPANGTKVIEDVKVSRGAFAPGQPVSISLGGSKQNAIVASVTSESIELIGTVNIGPEGTVSEGAVITSGVSAVSQAISGLASATIYHYRIAVTNSASPGEIVGSDHTFRTLSETGSEAPCPNATRRREDDSTLLPDCRAYEQVSSPLAGEVYGPYVPGASEAEPMSGRIFRAVGSGDQVTFAGVPTPGESGSGDFGGAGGNQYLATRSEGGWLSRDIQTPVFGDEYVGLNSDLSLGVLRTVRDPLSPDAVPGCRQELFATRPGSGAFKALITETQTPGFCGELPIFAGASADGSDLAFQSSAALTPGSTEAPGAGRENLYYSSAAGLTSVNILPGGVQAPEATFGGPGKGEETHGPSLALSNAVSTDGRLAYWTDRSTGTVYLRENPSRTEDCSTPSDACTVQVSNGDAQYWTATPDGHYAYYTEEGRLWRFDATAQPGSQSEALTSAGSEVQGVIGVNEEEEDGAYLYFVADAVLAGNAVENGAGAEQATAGQPNLYLDHEGMTSFITTLAPTDDRLNVGGSAEEESGGDWTPELSFRTAEATPNGRALVFESTLPLTGYDNEVLEPFQSNAPIRLPEVFVYAAGSARSHLACASCAPSGAQSEVTARGAAATALPVSRSPQFLHHWISADGSRVFFDTPQRLVPADEGTARDVYEWESEGSGTCVTGSPVNGGCVYLLSGGKAARQAFLVDAGRDGSDVFFTTRTQLTPTDQDNEVDLYDARVDGGFRALPPPPATCGVREACAGAASGPPSGTSPGTQRFEAPDAVRPPRCKKGYFKQKSKCVKRKAKKHGKKPKTKRHRQNAHKNRRAGK